MKSKEILGIIENFFYMLITLIIIFIMTVLKRSICRSDTQVRHLKHSGSKGLCIAYLRTDVSAGLRTGGALSHREGFVRGLMQTYNTVFVISSAHIPIFNKMHVRSYTIPPRKPHRLVPMTLYVLGYNILFVRKAFPIMMKELPDVICQRHSVFNITGLLLSYIFRIPLVLEYNSSAFWKREITEQLRLKVLLRAFEQGILHNACRIMVVSHVLRNHLVSRGNGAGKIFVNPNGADCDLFRPNVDGSKIRTRYGLGEAIVVGFTGVYGPWHGVEYLSQAVNAVAIRTPNVKFFFIGDERLVQVVGQITTSSNSAEHVVHATDISHSEMPQYLAACDVLVSPHVNMADGLEFFGSPVKIFEYMAMGRAIVASKIGQLSEIFISGENALLVEPGDIEGIAQAILRLINNKELRMNLGKEARRTVVGNYTWAHNAKRFAQACSVQPRGRSRK